MKTRLAATAFLLLANIVAIVALIFGAPIWFPASSLALTATLLWLGRSLPASRWTLAFLGPVVVVAILLNSLLAEAYYLTAAGFSESFFYHVRFDLLFAGLSEHGGLIAFAGLAVAGALLAYAVAIRSLARHRGLVLPIAAFVAALVAWSPFLGIASYVAEAMVYARPAGAIAALLRPVVHAASAATPAVTPSLPYSGSVQLRSPRKNLVVLYGESLERSYFDDPHFSDLTTELRGIRSQSLDFSDVSSGYATGWTVAGLVAMQCGYPLINDPLLNLVVARPMPTEAQPILPGATCLGDVLKANGYRVAYIGGADTRFAGKHSFLSVHGFDEVWGSRDIGDYLAGHPDVVAKPAIGPWGYQDETMLKVAKARFDSLAVADPPLALFILTLDTHHPSGLPSPSCARPGEDLMRQSIRCTSRLLAEFIRAIRAGPHSSETMIVVLSDHLAHRTSQTPLLPPVADRRLTFFVNDDDLRAGRNANSGLAFDVPATVLDLLGAEPSTIGAGQSLLRGEGFLCANDVQDRQKQYFLAPPMTAQLRGLWGEAAPDEIRP